ERGGGGGEEGGDLGLFALQDELRRQRVVDLLQLRAAGGLAVLGVGEAGDRLQRLFVEHHVDRVAVDLHGGAGGVAVADDMDAQGRVAGLLADEVLRGGLRGGEAVRLQVARAHAERDVDGEDDGALLRRQRDERRGPRGGQRGDGEGDEVDRDRQMLLARTQARQLESRHHRGPAPQAREVRQGEQARRDEEEERGGPEEVHFLRIADFG